MKLDTPWLALPCLMLGCLEARHLLTHRPGDALEGLAVIQHLESVLVDHDRDVLAGMPQADLEPLAADLDLPALADDPLDGDRPGRAAAGGGRRRRAATRRSPGSQPHPPNELEPEQPGHWTARHSLVP